MDYGVWTLVPVLLVIVFALKTKRTLESLIFGTMLTYVITNAALLPVEGVDALGHIRPTGWMPFPRGYRLLSSVGILGMCTFWKPDYLVGGFSWYPGFTKNFRATLPRAEIYHAGYMDYGYPNFCR